jgi:hypothetical protein
MTTRDTRDEQLSDEEWESALVRVVILNQEGKRQLRADRRALKERAEKAERALARFLAAFDANSMVALTMAADETRGLSAHVKEGEDV